MHKQTACKSVVQTCSQLLKRSWEAVKAKMQLDYPAVHTVCTLLVLANAAAGRCALVTRVSLMQTKAANGPAACCELAQSLSVCAESAA